jgi:DNA-binding LacI/PurR family transcriptional regulator
LPAVQGAVKPKLKRFKIVGTLEAMKRIAKLADVAKAAGVSQGTASNVFNRPQLVRPEVRERVEASARRLGYAGPDPKGRLLRAGKVNAIGIVMADDSAYFFRDPFARLLMAGIAEVCDERGAGVALVSAKRQKDAAWRIQTAVVDGFIVHCLRVGDRLISLARKRKLPFVAIDVDAGPGTSSVLIDDRRGAYLAARHLLDLGHRKIGILSLEGAEPRPGWIDAERLRSADYRTERDRAAGYAAALSEHGIELDQLPIMEVPNDRQVAASHAGELLSARPDTTAIIAMSDVLALAAIDAARARGLRVPQDLSVVGFDDIPEAATADPPLTTIAQPIVEKGRLAAKLIFEAGPPRTEVLGVQLVERASTARPRVLRQPA